MTILQGLQVKQSEVREKINALLGNESRTEDQDAELVNLTGDAQAIEPEIRAAIIASPDPQETVLEGDAESRELAQLTAKSNVGDILSATFEKREYKRRSCRASKALRPGFASSTAGNAADQPLELSNAQRRRFQHQSAALYRAKW